MDSYRLRPYISSDAQAVVDVINAASMQIVGFPRAVVAAVGNVWSHRFVPFTSEKIVSVNDRDEVSGYAYFTSSDNNIVAETGGAVHPDYWNQGIGTTLLEWAEERAKDTSHLSPAGVRTVLQASPYESETDVIALLKDQGYSAVRKWVHLVIELIEPPIVPALSSSLILREMDLDNDWDIVGPAMDEAFTNHWGNIPAELLASENTEKTEDAGEETPEGPTDDSYSNAPGYCFSVLDGDTVAGGILCNAKLVERNDTGRVGSIFVRPAYRRRGIAQTLMLAAFDAFWKNRFRRVITDTDANSFTDSTKLYKGLGMRPYRSEFTYEKEIRPGTEVRRLEV
jgi:GNAT superfamily N-acetyltransferase